MGQNNDRALDQVMKKTTVGRNIAYILAVLLPAIFFSYQFFAQRVVAQASCIFTNGEEFIIIGRSIYERHVSKVEQSESAGAFLDSLTDDLNTLDSFARLKVTNSTNNPVELKIQIPRMCSIREYESQFVILDITNDCWINETEIIRPDSNILGADETGSITLDSLPPSCSLYIEFAGSNAECPICCTNIYSNGKLIKISLAKEIFGFIGEYAQIVQQYKTLGIFLLILPAAILILIPFIIMDIRRSRQIEEPNGGIE